MSDKPARKKPPRKPPFTRQDPTAKPLPPPVIKPHGYGAIPAALNALGIEGLCGLLVEGHLMPAIADHLGVSKRDITSWVAADDARRKAVQEARQQGAETLVMRAEQVLREATTSVEVQRARELAQHYRWLASKMAPSDLGDRIEVKHTDDPRKLTDDDLDRRIARLTGAVIAAAVNAGKPSADS